MKKFFFSTVLLAFVGFCICSCGKECVCKTTRTTATTLDTLNKEMGKMSEKDCLEYNGTVNDSEGVVRTIDCHLN
ncbi:MAG: hypothetical protein J5642_07595 [Bacteroidales bacterium]|nr:hypothetical protein [Bacteroidales bacterium]